MSERTDASEALERLAWSLNYHEGESISVNKLAKKTDLSWATAKKYTQVLERLSRIAPEVNREDDGVSVGSVGDNLACIRDRPETQVIVYLIIHAENKGGSIEPLPIEDHRDVLNRYDATIDHLVDIGWIEINGEQNTIRLTPSGVAQAGQARSKLRNTDLDSPSYGRIIDKGDIVRTSNTHTQSNWATGDYMTDEPSQDTDVEASVGYDSKDYQSSETSDNWIRA